MSEIIKYLAEFTPGAVGIWLFGTVLVSGQVLKWIAEYRAWRKLPLDQKQANREGFTAQVELLTKQLAASDEENRRTRAEIATLRKEYDEYRHLCHKETDQLRRMVINLEGELAGHKRTMDTRTIEAVRKGDL